MLNKFLENEMNECWMHTSIVKIHLTTETLSALGFIASIAIVLFNGWTRGHKVWLCNRNMAASSSYFTFYNFIAREELPLYPCFQFEKSRRNLSARSARSYAIDRAFRSPHLCFRVVPRDRAIVSTSVKWGIRYFFHLGAWHVAQI